MTKIKFLLFALLCVVLTLQTTSCSSGGDDNGDGGTPPPVVTGVTGINLNKETASIQVGGTETLQVTLLPAGQVATVAWSSEHSDVASVSTAGVVTAIKVGTTQIVATVGAITKTCIVTVTAEPVVSTDDSLNGSDYYVIQLDQTSFESLGDKVAKDLRPDPNASKNLYTWITEGDGVLTFDPGVGGGKNFYGLSDGYVSYVVPNKNLGWSGAGWNVGADFGLVDMTNLKKNPELYVLHIGYKTSQPGKSWMFTVDDADTGTNPAKFAVGANYVDGAVTTTSYAPLVTDGEWHALEIPVTYLNSKGVYFNRAWTNKNILAVLAGGTAGTTVDLDAIFFYKK